jgi:hypothetical protein
VPVGPPPLVPAGEARERLVGLLCPRGAAGRPALTALAERLPRAWTSDPDVLRRNLGAGRPAELAVLGWNGKRAGWFTAAGVAPALPATALGGYAGARPCADEATATECVAASGDCGLAVGSPAGDDPTPRPGGACVAGDALVVDVDGDGRLESFPRAALAALEEEVLGAPAPLEVSCPPRPALAAGGDLDVLAVADLDGDGRVELLVARRGTPRRLALYTADATLRLTRVGLATVGD